MKCPKCGSEMELPGILDNRPMETYWYQINNTGLWYRPWKCPKCGHEEKVKP